MALKGSLQYAGILLSGGRSRRYGSPKAFAVHQKDFFYEKVLNSMLPYVQDYVIVSHPTLTEKFKMCHGKHVIEDVVPYKGNGPLAGIYSGMKAISAEAYLILPCDMPFIEASTIEWLFQQFEENSEYAGLMMKVSGRLQPLVSILRPSVLQIIEKLLVTNQLKMMRILDLLPIKVVDGSDIPRAAIQFRNINKPEEYFHS